MGDEDYLYLLGNESQWSYSVMYYLSRLDERLSVGYVPYQDRRRLTTLFKQVKIFKRNPDGWELTE